MDIQTTVESPAASKQQGLGDIRPLLQSIVKFLRHDVRDEFLAMAEQQSGCSINGIHLNNEHHMQWNELSDDLRGLFCHLFDRFVLAAVYMVADEYGFGFVWEEGMDSDAEQIDKDTPSEMAEEIRETGRVEYIAIILAVINVLLQMLTPEDPYGIDESDESEMPSLMADNDNSDEYDESDESYMIQRDNEQRHVIDNLGYIIADLCTIWNWNSTTWSNFAYSGIAHKALAELIRNTQIGTRFERLEKEKEVGEGVGDRVIGGGENWDDDEVEDDFAELGEELNETENGRERAYEEGMAWIRREFGDGDDDKDGEDEGGDDEEI
ncbi:hypothetical protein FPQ18DRAFT_305253 [Pyronema domesticum]|nr:hypothetical protein FPQ18DRAFT_305253 [Pyronema domesticum]